MPKNKDNPEPLQTTEELLEARVDAMMDVSTPKTPAQPDLDIFADPTPGAPALAQPIAEAEPTETTEITPAIDLPSNEEAAPTPDLDTPQSDAAIADIVAQEADQVLAAEDAGILAAQDTADNIPEEPANHGHPIFWFGVLLLVAIAVIAAIMLTSPGLAVPFLD
jgi:hypothetical protein